MKVLAIPQQVDDTDFGLSNLEPNAAFLKKLHQKTSLKKVSTVTVVSKKVVLPVYKTGDSEDNGYYWVEYEGQILWLVKFKLFRRDWLPVPAVSQVALWRDDSMFLPSAFTKKMFFDFVLKRHKAVLSDKEQTPAGERFWKRRLREALDKRLNIAFVNFNDQTLKQIESLEELNELGSLAWGRDRSKQNFRWIIWI